MQGQLTAHKATVEMIREQAEKDKQSSLDTQQERHNKNLGEDLLYFHLLFRSNLYLRCSEAASIIILTTNFHCDLRQW